jgi:hypothetical protein
VIENSFMQHVNTVLSKPPHQSDSSFKKELAALTERGVNSYDTLFSLMRDPKTDRDTLLQACSTVFYLSSYADQRRVTPVLLSILKRHQEYILQTASWVLIALKSRQALPFLIALSVNQQEDFKIRIVAIQALTSIEDRRPIPILRKLILDRDEHVAVRCEAIEWLSWYMEPTLISDYIALLADEAADVRFWAAYGLQNLSWKGDISPALSELDRVAAFDHNLPVYGGWHVNREALDALELIYWDRANQDDWTRPGIHLISPAPEYRAFSQQYRKWRDDWTYETLPSPVPTLRVDPVWFIDKLREQYPAMELNTRQPKLKTYLIDWRLELEDHLLIGGLHRDGYAVVLMGDHALVYPFAAWYRSLITMEQPLYLYEWADEGMELLVGMTAKDIEDAVERIEAAHRQPATL